MSQFHNNILIPSSSLSALVGHRFTGRASFPWHSSTSGDVMQGSTIHVVVQTQKVADFKFVVIEGEITLDPNGHNGAKQFRLDNYEIVVKVLHGKHTETMEPHPLQCKLMHPEWTQIPPNSSIILNPTPNHLSQLQFITSASKTYLGALIRANRQSQHAPSQGTVWEHRVDNLTDKIWGRFLGTFVSSYLDCSGDQGCSLDDPTMLSITITAWLTDTKAGASRRPLEQVLSINYSDWPDQSFPAGIEINTDYDASTTGHELNILETSQLRANGHALPAGVACSLSVTRILGPSLRTRILSSKIMVAKDIIVGNAKALGHLIQHPSRIPEYFVAPHNPSNMGPISR